MEEKFPELQECKVQNTKFYLGNQHYCSKTHIYMEDIYN